MIKESFGLNSDARSSNRKEYDMYILCDNRGNFYDITASNMVSVLPRLLVYGGITTSNGQLINGNIIDSMRKRPGIYKLKSPTGCNWDPASYRNKGQSKNIYWWDIFSCKSKMTDAAEKFIRTDNDVARALKQGKDGLGLIADSFENISGVISKLEFIARFDCRYIQIKDVQKYKEQLAEYQKNLKTIDII